MNVEHREGRAVFRDDAGVAGEMVLDDRFKPYLHPLRTPRGHVVTVAMPGDHRHHKGLMYALRAADLNFWEENPGAPDCGVQEVRGAEVDGPTLRLELLWRAWSGGLETYREERTVAVRRTADGHGFLWTWASRRLALRAHRLVKSEWSLPLPDGRAINYHGLGIRLPWMWRFPGPWGAVEADGVDTPPLAACGTTGPAVGFRGLVDGQWERTMAAVTLRQDHSFGWFVLKGDFCYLSAGPSNLHELEVAAGVVTEERYEVLVEDRPAA